MGKVWGRGFNSSNNGWLKGSIDLIEKKMAGKILELAGRCLSISLACISAWLVAFCRL